VRSSLCELRYAPWVPRLFLCCFRFKKKKPGDSLRTLRVLRHRAFLSCFAASGTPLLRSSPGFRMHTSHFSEYSHCMPRSYEFKKKKPPPAALAASWAPRLSLSLRCPLGCPCFFVRVVRHKKAWRLTPHPSGAPSSWVPRLLRNLRYPLAPVVARVSHAYLAF
jgi:hypothetical protein